MTQEEHGKLDILLNQNDTIFELLNGKQGRLGLLQKVEIMWRGHVWLLCTLSGGAGTILGVVVTVSVKHFWA